MIDRILPLFDVRDQFRFQISEMLHGMKYKKTRG